MGKYNFVSTGAAASEALQKFMMQRAVEERQAQLDAQVQQERLAASSRAERQLTLQQEQEKRVAAAQVASQADLANQREAQWAQNRVQNSLPDQDVSGETRAKLARQGYEGAYTWKPPVPGILMQGPQEGDAQGEEGRPTSPDVPGAYRMVGSPAWHLAREAAEERRAQAEALQLARDAQADEALQARIAMDTANRESRDQNAAATRAITGMLAASTLGDRAAKRATAQEKADADASAARAQTQSALALATRLPTMKGLDVATGAYEPRGFTQDAVDFNAVRDQLVAALTQPHLGALKGPMSDKDVIFVKLLATRLENRKLSRPETLKAISEAQTFLREKLAEAPQGGGGAGGGGGKRQQWGRGPDGRPVMK